jgi:hypothetical protein
MLAAALMLLPFAPLARAHAPSTDSKRFALVIGINDYDARTVDTVGSEGDAVDVREALLKNGWPDGNIKMLVGATATGSAIRNGMRWLVDNSAADTFSVFHYSGHTKQMDGVPDAEGWDEYLWSKNNQFISDNEFTDQMKAIRGHLWANVSNCEAAGFDDGFSGPDKLFTASSQESEKGYEDAGWQKSVFSGLMVREGLINGRGDANGDKRVSLDEAFAYAAENAPKMTMGARPYGPQHPFRAGGGGGEWFLSPPPPAQVTDVPAPLNDLPVVRDLLPLLPDPPAGTPPRPPLPGEQSPGTPPPAPLPPLPPLSDAPPPETPALPLPPLPSRLPVL